MPPNESRARARHAELQVMLRTMANLEPEERATALRLVSVLEEYIVHRSMILTIGPRAGPPETNADSNERCYCNHSH